MKTYTRESDNNIIHGVIRISLGPTRGQCDTNVVPPFQKTSAFKTVVVLDASASFSFAVTRLKTLKPFSIFEGRFFCSASASACNDNFSKYLKLEPAVRGEHQANINTVDVCRNACLAIPTCVGFTFSRMPSYKGQDCILSTSVINATNTSELYDLFTRQFCQTTMEKGLDPLYTL